MPPKTGFTKRPPGAAQVVPSQVKPSQVKTRMQTKVKGGVASPTTRFNYLKKKGVLGKRMSGGPAQLTQGLSTSGTKTYSV